MERTNFAWLFSGILLLLVVQPAVYAGSQEIAATFEGVFTSLLLVGVWSLRSYRRWFLVALGCVVVDLLCIAMRLTVGGLVWDLLSNLSLLVFCVLCAGLALRFILAHRQIDTNHLMGAMSVYLLLGVIWEILFETLLMFDANALANVTAVPGEPGAVGELIYFSFVTLTTLGYGDVLPVTPLARNLAMLEAAIGQLFVAVLIASLIGRLAAPPAPIEASES